MERRLPMKSRAQVADQFRPRMLQCSEKNSIAEFLASLSESERKAHLDSLTDEQINLVAGRATALCAAALLEKLIAEAPFRIEGIEVDGGSEFRAEFEDACRERNLCLFVLPPKRPQLNGHVERAQGSWRYEFYGVEDLPSRLKPLQLRIDAFAHRFNHTRPRQALGDLTPAEYLSTISQEIAPSHMG